MQQEPVKAASRQQGIPWVSAATGPLKRRIHGMGLLSRLLAAEVVVFALVFAGGVLLITQMTDSLRDNIIEDQLLLGKIIAEDLDASLEHGIMELQQLAIGYRLAVDRDDPAGIQRSLELIAGESTMFTQDLLIVGSGGTVIAEDMRKPGLVELDLERYWPALWDNNDAATEVLTSAFQVPGRASPTVAIAVPVIGGRDGEYVVGLIDSLNSYPARAVARAARLGGSGHADIIDENGIALFSTEVQHLLKTSDHPASYRSLFLQKDPTISELPHDIDGTADGEPHLMAFVPLKSLPWAISSGTSISEAFASVRQLWNGGLGFLAVLTGFAFTATVFVGRRLVQPVKILSQTAKAVAGGDRSVTTSIPWGGEIGELAGSLEIMRLRLQAWGSELEEQVQQRTSELEERNRELRMLYETLQSNDEQLRALLGKVLGAQEDERKRVSRELHDGIGQALSALSMGLERLEQARPEQWPNLREHVEELKDLATYTLGDLRRLTIALRPAALDDLGLVPAIRRYAELYLGNAGVSFQIQEEGPSLRLTPDLETVIYRVVQEAINNVARHSEAASVTIKLRSSEGTFTVMVEDNGKGFDPILDTSKHGVGLQGMEERASLAGGKLTVASQLGHGTTVRLEIPLLERDRTQKDV